MRQNEGARIGALTTLKRSPGGETGFPLLLKAWQQKRHLSQLDLALSSGVSQRHVSFLESGRANPSRSMILQLSETLDVPLRERNAWLTAAGFAPISRTRPLDDPQMSQVMNDVQLMLTNHEPFPAIALDRAWNIRMSNTPFEMMSTMLGGDLWQHVGGTQRNLMRLFFHPRGIRPLITNWPAIGPLIWHRAQREAELDHGQWRGQQIVPAEWIADSLRPHISTGFRSPPTATLGGLARQEIGMERGLRKWRPATLCSAGTGLDRGHHGRRLRLARDRAHGKSVARASCFVGSTLTDTDSECASHRTADRAAAQRADQRARTRAQPA